MSLTDKRVDRMLQRRNITATAIYYSPITAWLVTLLLFLMYFGLALYLIVISGYYLYMAIYLILGYLVAARMNTSFAVTDSELIVVNPNFPFNRIEVIALSDIEHVTIDRTRSRWHYAFLIFGDNYLLIKTKTSIMKYYCAGLELDAFDENWTELTIEDLHYALTKRGVGVTFNLE
ncbi:MAG TPA: hypothetical protein VK154_15695 [Chitinophagales bacterium]|nr:hypothetical protein [Chitinophagales bacterium]